MRIINSACTENCICNVLIKSIKQVSTSLFQLTKLFQDQKQNQSLEKLKINKLINSFFRQDFSDHNINNNNKKSNSDEKRVKKNTFEINFWKNQMQEIKFIIIKKILKFRFSIENIHVLKFQTLSQIMHDSKFQFKFHFTHDFESKISKTLNLFRNSQIFQNFF